MEKETFKCETELSASTNLCVTDLYCVVMRER